MLEKIKSIAEDLNDEIVAVRRDFHKFPELGFREFRTASLIARKLANSGCPIKVGREIMDADSRMNLPSAEVLAAELGRARSQGGDPEYLELMKGGFPAVVAILGDGDGPTVALRVDIDALPIPESSDQSHFPAANGFASVNEGIMHACGHDGHAATGLGVVEILTRLKDDIKGTAKIVFQPAEEGVCGARPIVESGILDDVDRIFNIHYSSVLDSGAVVCVREPGHLATDKLDVTFKGAAAHAGSQPQAGKNALMAAANAVINLNAIPRHNQGATRVNVGKLAAGTARNAICERAFMEVETRGQTTELNAYMLEHANRVLNSSAEMWECELDVKPMGSSPAGGSDDDVADMILDYAAKTKVLTPTTARRDCGSEDFTCMLERVRAHGGKGACVTVGAGPRGHHHASDFDIDEAVLKDAAAFAAGLILEFLEAPPKRH